MILCLGLMIRSAAVLSAETSAPDSSPIYDPDPKHLWNRLNDSLFVRTAPDGTRYGVGQPDILFWSNTRHLLAAPSHAQAIGVLDDFIRERGERLISDPLKRALLQRDLWQLFDWTASPWTPGTHFANERAELQTRLVTVIRRLALSAKEIAALADNYARAEANENLADLPRGLFAREGHWLIVGAKQNEPTAAVHTLDFGGRSIFLVMVRFPEGRQQAISYLQRLRDFGTASVNPALPQFPINTEWALVRRLCVIDEQGEIQPTPLIESVQLRRYVKIATDAAGALDPTNAPQRFAKFHMDRRNGAVLKPVAAADKDFHFVQFRSHGTDPFEFTNDREPRRDPARFRTETLRTCATCHQAPGMLSVLSYNRLFSTPPIESLESSSVDEESAVVLQWKRRQFDWGLLQGLWRQVPRISSGGADNR